MARRRRERIISVFQAFANTDVSNIRANNFISMIAVFFRWTTPSIHPRRRDAARRRHCFGRRLEKDIFAKLRRIYLSKPDPTVPGARIRDFPAASRLPALLRSRRPAPELRAGGQGAGGDRRRRRPPHPHPGGPSRRRAVRAKAPRRVPQPPRSRLLRGDPAHPPRNPRDHPAPRRPQALPRPPGDAFPPLRPGG